MDHQPHRRLKRDIFNAALLSGGKLILIDSHRVEVQYIQICLLAGRLGMPMTQPQRQAVLAAVSALPYSSYFTSLTMTKNSAIEFLGQLFAPLGGTISWDKQYRVTLTLSLA